MYHTLGVPKHNDTLHWTLSSKFHAYEGVPLDCFSSGLQSDLVGGWHWLSAKEPCFTVTAARPLSANQWGFFPFYSNFFFLCLISPVSVPLLLVLLEMKNIFIALLWLNTFWFDNHVKHLSKGEKIVQVPRFYRI